MSNLEVWLIIILVIAVIVSNLAVLKYSAKFKMTQFGKDHAQKTTSEKHKQRDEDDSSQTTAQNQDDHSDNDVTPKR